MVGRDVAGDEVATADSFIFIMENSTSDLGLQPSNLRP